MAITVVPPAALTSQENLDLSSLNVILVSLAGVLERQSAIDVADRTMSTDTIDSINTTITDASDRIDAIINPAAPAV